MSRDEIVGVLLILLAAAVLALGVWSQVAAPCSSFKYTTAQHVPARCLGVK